MEEISENSEQKISCSSKTKIRIVFVNFAALAAIVGAISMQKHNLLKNPKDKMLIGGKIIPKANAEYFKSDYDAWLKQNSYIMSYTSTPQSQYSYDNEWKVVSAGYTYNGEQEVIHSFEEEENIVSKGGTPIWYGTLDENGEIIYFRKEDIKASVFPKENEQQKVKKTRNLAVN